MDQLEGMIKQSEEQQLCDYQTILYHLFSALLPKMRRILRESHLNLYKTCEVSYCTKPDCSIRMYLRLVHLFLLQHLSFQQYYRAKGTSPSTRPDEIPETFELCMDSLIERLHSYQIQAEEYRRECIDGT